MASVHKSEDKYQSSMPAKSKDLSYCFLGEDVRRVIEGLAWIRFCQKWVLKLRDEESDLIIISLKSVVTEEEKKNW